MDFVSRALNETVPEGTDPCKWLTSQDHTLTFVSSSIFVLLAIWLSGGVPVIWREYKRLSGSKEENFQLNFFDHICGACLVAVHLWNIYSRFVRGVPTWLLQPCHILTALLIYYLYSRKTAVAPYYTYAFWLSAFAFIGVNWSWYLSWAEVAGFWVQHILLVTLPYWYIFSGRLDALYVSPDFRKNRLKTLITVHMMGLLYHAWVLLPLSIFEGTDYNHMLCPIPGVSVGKWWRELLAAFSFVWAICLCYIPETIYLSFFFKGQQEVINAHSQLKQKAG